MHEKLDDLRTTDRSWKQSEVEVPPGHARHRRQRLPVKVILQHRRLSAWRPGTAAVRALAQSALVDEDDGAPLFAGFFFNLRPTLLLPQPDLFFVPLQRPPHWTLAAPAQLPQNAPGLRGMVADSAFLFDQMGHAPTRSTNWFRSPELAAHASARARYASDLPDANAVCAQPVPLSSGRAVRPAGVAAPSGSLTADALPPGGPLPPEELPAATAEPRVSVAAPVPENLAELLLGFPWTDHSRRRPECHYIIQYLITVENRRFH